MDDSIRTARARRRDRRRPNRAVAIGTAALLTVAAMGVAGAQTGDDGGEPATVGAAAVPASEAEVFVGFSPVRVLDTRSTDGGPIGRAGKLGPGETIDLGLAGSGRPLPAEATSAVMNVTLDQDASSKSFLTIWPTGQGRPNASANNAEPGFVAANSMIARIGAGGAVSIYNSQGETNVIIDVVGYLLPVNQVTGLGGGGATTSTLTPANGSPCNTGQVNYNTANGEVSVCVAGAWDSPVELRNTVDGATTYAANDVTPVDLGATFVPVTTFSAPGNGSYLLDASVTIRQSADDAGAPVLFNAQCRWAIGATVAGPTVSESSTTQASAAGTPNTVFLGPKARADLAVGADATLECAYTTTGAADFEVLNWAYTATRTPALV